MSNNTVWMSKIFNIVVYILILNDGLNGSLLFGGKQLFGDYLLSSSAFPVLFIVKYQSSEESYIVKIVR